MSTSGFPSRLIEGFKKMVFVVEHSELKEVEIRKYFLWNFKENRNTYSQSVLIYRFFPFKGHKQAFKRFTSE